MPSTAGNTYNSVVFTYYVRFIVAATYIALMHSIPPLHLYLYYLCFVLTVYRCYQPVIVQHTIALCPLSTQERVQGRGPRGLPPP